MLVGCNTLSFVGDRKTDISAMEFLASAGFKCIDLNLNRYGVRDDIDDFWKQPKARLWDYAYSIRDAAERLGLKIAQIHSPYPTYFPQKRKRHQVFEIGEDCLCLAGIMGAPYVVIHPNVPPQCKTEDEIAAAVEENIKYYGGFAPLLRQTGVLLGLENMFNWDFSADCALPTVASTADSMCYMLDSLNCFHGENLYVACLDTGHAMLSGGGDLPGFIKKLAHRLRLMHVHDNDGHRDKHLPPYSGIIDWGAVAKALAEVNYCGNITLEVKTKTDFESTVRLYSAAEKLKTIIEMEKENELHHKKTNRIGL